MSNSRKNSHNYSESLIPENEHIPEKVREELRKHGFSSVDDFLDAKHKEFCGEKDPVDSTPEVFYTRVLGFFAEQDKKEAPVNPTPVPLKYNK